MQQSLNFGVIFDLDTLKKQASELEAKTHVVGFWDDQDNAQQILKEKSDLENRVSAFSAVSESAENVSAYIELLEESGDLEVPTDLLEEYESFGKALEQLQLTVLLGEEDDPKNALVTINPGAGGTESQDWAAMLFRMFQRWAEKADFKFSLMDYQEGDVAGIKGASFKVSGDYAFGNLKSESGVHRLVRISPFDSGGRRHTSFASVFVYPEVSDNIDIEINTTDIRIDTYRASGAGGQHVNKTDSAVRITHEPTGIVVQCQDGRSQHQNKDSAMKMLKSRLYQLERDKQREEKAKLEGDKMEIGFGSQIRSYVFHPYHMVKDHRTNSETSNTTAVMDGDINQFILAYLNSRSN